MPIDGPKLERPVRPSSPLERGVRATPDEVALVSLAERWSWRDLDRASNRIAANLLSLGLKPGDRVASLMPNRPALVLHYLACMKANLVATPLNYRYAVPEIDHALELSGASILLAHAERDTDVTASQLARTLPRGVISYGAADGRSPSFEELRDREPPRLDLPTGKPDDPVVIFFTSGSTGLPKGVTHTFATFGWLLASAISEMELTAKDVVLPGSSLSHISGFALSSIGLAAGARVVVARTVEANELIPLLDAERPTVLVMLPAALFTLVRDHGATGEDFKSLRVCISGGDKVSAELEREFSERTDLQIDEGYGMTEIGFSTLNPLSGLNKPGSVGKLAPGFSMSIRDVDGTEVAAGQERRLWVKSPCNMVGYWGAQEATAETIRDGWLDTGDVMCADEDGYLWFRGRKKQIIVHDGSNISPQEVEEALLEHPAVEIAGVVGVHNLLHGESVRAYITLKPDTSRPTSQAIIQFVRTRIAAYKTPDEVIVLTEMPINPTGKVDRMTLRKWTEDQTHPLHPG